MLLFRPDVTTLSAESGGVVDAAQWGQGKGLRDETLGTAEDDDEKNSV